MSTRGRLKSTVVLVLLERLRRRRMDITLHAALLLPPFTRRSTLERLRACSEDLAPRRAANSQSFKSTAAAALCRRCGPQISVPPYMERATHSAPRRPSVIHQPSNRAAPSALQGFCPAASGAVLGLDRYAHGYPPSLPAIMPSVPTLRTSSAHQSPRVSHLLKILPRGERHRSGTSVLRRRLGAVVVSPTAIMPRRGLCPAASGTVPGLQRRVLPCCAEVSAPRTARTLPDPTRLGALAGMPNDDASSAHQRHQRHLMVFAAGGQQTRRPPTSRVCRLQLDQTGPTELPTTQPDQRIAPAITAI
uniref:Uncharacterized protein n=1 Tax=Mycena chlorophos TaxID=658473 RepID=A0ABQ0KU48_MYCCL|nr:predicted protein [Mycena chlorophos]